MLPLPAGGPDLAEVSSAVADEKPREPINAESRSSYRLLGSSPEIGITTGMVRRLNLHGGIRGNRRRPMELHTIGIDLGKTVFHLSLMLFIISASDRLPALIALIASRKPT